VASGPSTIRVARRHQTTGPQRKRGQKASLGPQGPLKCLDNGRNSSQEGSECQGGGAASEPAQVDGREKARLEYRRGALRDHGLKATVLDDGGCRSAAGGATDVERRLQIIRANELQ
jgi:hypothetical protein